MQSAGDTVRVNRLGRKKKEARAKEEPENVLARDLSSKELAREASINKRTTYSFPLGIVQTAFFSAANARTCVSPFRPVSSLSPTCFPPIETR